MGKIYKIEYSKENLEKLYSIRINKNDYEGALCVIDTMRKYYITDYLVYEKYATIYYNIEEYDKAVNYWYLYLSSCPNNLVSKAYNGLGACFYKMDNNDLASYYFNEQLNSNQKGNYAYNDVIIDFYDEISDVKKEFYLAYPYEKANFDKLLSKVILYIKSGYYEKALDCLEIIPEKSKYYVDALIQKALCKYLIGKTNEALKDISLAVSLNKDNIIALFNAISMFYACGKTLETEKLLINLKNSKEYNNPEHFEKTAMIYCEIKDYKTAEEFLDKCLKINPNKLNVLQLNAITKFNLGKYDESLNLFSRKYRIDKNYISKYYLDLVKKAIVNAGNGEISSILDYTFDVQNKEYKKIIKQFNKFIEHDLIDKKHYLKVKNIIDYAFVSRDIKLQIKSINILKKLDENTAIELSCNYLLKSETFDTVKRMLISLVVNKGYEGNLPFIFGNVFKKLYILQPKFSIVKDSRVFKEAYCECISKIAPLEKDITLICSTTNLVIERLKDSKYLELIDDISSLSAVIYELSEIKQIKSRRAFLNFFNANQKTVKKYKDYINESDYLVNDEFEALLNEIASSLDNEEN